MAGRIVVGIDGSEQSGQALEWAVARARLGGEQLELFNAYSITPAVDFYGYHTIADSRHLDWYAETSRELLEAAQKRVRELAPDLTCTLTSEMGHPATRLAAASEGATALVVGRRGLGRAASAVLGSVSNRLTIDAQCPVVVVGEEQTPTTGPVVVGVDGSEFGKHALRHALAEAALRETSARAVTAYDLVHPPYLVDAELVARFRAESEAEAADTIARALDDLQETDAAPVPVEHVTVEGRAAEAILASSDDAQLIVVGTHGKGLVRRLLLGSVSRRVLHEADRPVVVVDLPES